MIRSGAMRQEIERLAREFEDTYRRRDFRAMANFYTDNATLMPAGQATVRGRGAIAQVFQSLYEMGVDDLTININAVESSGDFAYESGTGSFGLRPPSGKAASSRTIRYLVIWKQQPTGQWQIAADISNGTS